MFGRNLRPAERAQRGRGEQVEWTGIEMGNLRFAAERHRHRELGREGDVDRWVVATHGGPIGEGEERDRTVIDGAELQEAIDAAETSRGLAAAELARNVSDGIQSVPDHATPVELKLLAALAAHRLDGVAPQVTYHPNMHRPISPRPAHMQGSVRLS